MPKNIICNSTDLCSDVDVTVKAEHKCSNFCYGESLPGESSIFVIQDGKDFTTLNLTILSRYIL